MARSTSLPVVSSKKSEQYLQKLLLKLKVETVDDARRKIATLDNVGTRIASPVHLLKYPKRENFGHIRSKLNMDRSEDILRMEQIKSRRADSQVYVENEIKSYKRKENQLRKKLAAQLEEADKLRKTIKEKLDFRRKNGGHIDDRDITRRVLRIRKDIAIRTKYYNTDRAKNEEMKREIDELRSEKKQFITIFNQQHPHHTF